jgi:diguanylate cyclase (GGDEF)-like protein
MPAEWKPISDCGMGPSGLFRCSSRRSRSSRPFPVRPEMSVPRAGGRPAADNGDRLDAMADLGSDQTERYWRTHIRIGFAVFLGEVVAIIVYLGLTPHGPHRPILYGMAFVWFVFATTNLLLAPTIATRPWRSRFSVTWTVLAAFALASFAVLDRGMNSPVVLLLFIPICYACLSFNPIEATVCGISTLASAVIVVVIGNGSHVAEGTLAMLLAALAGASVLSVAAARNRSLRERHEQLLLEEIVTLGATDGLTGCVVHRVFHDRLGEEIDRSHRYGQPLSLILVDVDDFKSVNDTYGHLVGDNTLAAVGTALRNHVRSVDLVGRVGGDEFAVLLPNTLPQDAVELARRIRHDLPGVLDCPVTLSFGVSRLDQAAVTSEQMLDDADLALYQVKRSGRDAVAMRL